MHGISKIERGSMSYILVVTGSARPNSVNQVIVPLVVEGIERLGQKAEIADLAELDLPFFNSQFPPASPKYKIDDTPDGVQKWTKMVKGATAVVFVLPEYNHTLSPLQLNAIDWIGKPWANKPVALVSYGWSLRGERAAKAARAVLTGTLKANVIQEESNFAIAPDDSKDLKPDGAPVNQPKVDQSLDETLKALIASV